MIYEKSCGVIGYRTGAHGERLYLIIRSVGGDYGFPKGHTESDEKETDTALRELLEETGISAVLHEGIRFEAVYTIPKRNISKTVVYFVGECLSEEPIIQESEISEARFIPYNDALSLLSFDNIKEILKKAEHQLSTVQALNNSHLSGLSH